MVALGDGLNDLGMLRLAGTSIAMQNAVDAAKDVAGMVSEKSNDVRAPLACFGAATLRFCAGWGPRARHLEARKNLYCK